MDFEKGDVVVASPWIISLEQGADGEYIQEVINEPVWLLVEEEDPAYIDCSCELLFSLSERVQQLMRDMGATHWTSGCVGSEHRKPSCEEWPDEVCVIIAQKKLSEWK